jgi:Ca2+-transporting ATPase
MDHVSGAGYEPIGEFVEESDTVGPDVAVQELLRAGVLSSDARLVNGGGQWRIEGDPTEGALIVAAAKAGVDHGEANQLAPRLEEIPFTSERRRMTTLHDASGERVAYSKGAADIIMEGSSCWSDGSQESAFTPEIRGATREAERRMAAEGLRVLAISRKSAASLADAEEHMTFLGLVGIMDPPRAEAKSAVHTCLNAGITR